MFIQTKRNHPIPHHHLSSPQKYVSSSPRLAGKSRMKYIHHYFVLFALLLGLFQLPPCQLPSFSLPAFIAHESSIICAFNSIASLRCILSMPITSMLSGIESRHCSRGRVLPTHAIEAVHRRIARHAGCDEMAI
ncbi:hypothetical protein P389DRAFT_60088 [Cystobasidium minutum MCA 4210]|uniref:uncharacterized protein n=1 Tax=Cystobasidium minutum MCA 4210 TaxID=1397322 RepID=UPI0034CDDB47|eukprot:jgi/Rhomi1/60088/CE60087_249